MTFIDSYEKILKNKQKILVVMAHPDDADIFAGATIARLVKDGKEVRIVKMTLGNKGAQQQQISEQDLSTLRKNEDMKAMEILGIKPENNIYLDFKDGEVENTLKEIEAVVEQIRIFKPELIITHNPEDLIIRFAKDENWINHRDHRNTGKTTVDATYPYSRDILFFPEQFKNPEVQSYTCTEFLFTDSYNHEDTVAIEVTDFVDIRTAAIASHSSQYSQEKAQISTDYFTKLDDSSKRYERFRYVLAD